MTEIKSTLDLVMERTRHLVQSDEEKQEARGRELKAKAKGVLLKLTDEYITPEDLSRTLEESAGDDAKDVEGILAELMIEAIKPGADQAPLFGGLKIVFGAAAEGLISKILEFSQEYIDKKETLKTGASANILKRLAESGIKGSAVTPNPETDPSYETELGIMAQDFENRWATLKTELKAAYL